MNIADTFSPSRKRLRVSFPKEENVVKPPRTPTIKSVLVSRVKTPRVSAMNERKPMMKQPARFTARVPYGKLMLPLRFWTMPLAEYLSADPMNPPTPTRRILNKVLFMFRSSE